MCSEGQEFISWTELGTICRRISKPATDSELKLMVSQVDSNGTPKSN